MKRILLILLCAVPMFASVHVTAAYPYIGELVKTIGGNKTQVSVLGTSSSDPHFVVPRPSFIGVLRQSDLLILNGGGLEIGWIPPLLSQANNPKIIQGSSGYFDLSKYVKTIDKPASLSRAQGDVHADGNPHYALDPYNIPILAKVIMLKLSEIDPAEKAFYRANYDAFAARWKEKLTQWEQQMAPCRNSEAVQYHELFSYFLNRYGIRTADTIEPLPGISPSSRHTMELISLMRDRRIGLIVQDTYHEPKTAQFIADKTGAKVVSLPYDVGTGAKDLESLFDIMSSQICRH
ncbi:metal ABC transporter substrate-binding protein [Sulfuricurvum sp.]|uniref:metal ABC transporter substrate-binding protein n=1 Tax=Sulfuricurvum sp. TaxID=2025608 RepID=UPI00260A0ED4|nr:metal ABC transporter substrate-binding protein [Sulfuricurvum sp.]MDD4884290.1 metal ABC transporter substrate-binding protein [Sulfuricurvum sp.]